MAKIAEVQEVAIAVLKPYERNAKQHGADQIDKLIKSIEEFGFLTPCLIDRDHNIIAGHGRVMAARKMGMQTVPCVYIEGLSEAQRKAYILADNRLGELGEWDMDLVMEELTALDDMDFDVTVTGFDLPDLTEADEVVEDDYSEDVETRCKLGDLWQLGDHRLICGDSTDVNVIDRLMDGQKADVVYTDPPYGMDLDTDYSDMKNRMFKGGMSGNRYDAGNVDEFTPDMINSIFALNAPETFIFGADYFAELIPDRNDGSWIVWDKRANGNDDIAEDYSSDKMYGSCFELCWSKTKHKRDIARVKWAGVFGTEQEFDHKRHHPTQKPVKLSAWFISRYSKDGDNIVDLFGGSGSTLLACEQLGRKCYMAELDPHYCDVIINRWEQLTGREAVLINA